MAITIPDSDGRDQYVATAAQTVFPYTYPVFDEDHLVVQHTVDATGVTTTLTITTDYTVDGVGTDNGDVTLVSGAAVDDVITIERDTPIARLTDFLDGGDYRAESINRELDLIIQMMQQNERNIGRAFRLQSEDVSVDLLIPLLAARAGKFLVFDASGDPDVASGSGADAALRTDLAAAGGAKLVGNPATGGLAGITVGDQLDELELEKATLASPTFTGDVTLPTATAGGLFKFTKGGDIASASPLVIDTDGNYFDVTGTTNFAAMTVAAGALFIVQFDGVLTMTHHATNLDLPGEANITTAAGDSMICFATGANTVHVLSYTRADGKAVISSSVLVQEVYVEDGAVATGTTVMVLDDTIPQSGEGDQYMSLAITPKDAANDLYIDVVVHSAQSGASDQTMVALFKDAGANAIAASLGTRTSVANGPRTATFTHKISAGSTSAQTFKVRAGGTAGTMTFNGISAGIIFGGVMASSIRIREVTP